MRAEVSKARKMYNANFWVVTLYAMFYSEDGSSSFTPKL
jgi:hypothetical protein